MRAKVISFFIAAILLMMSSFSAYASETYTLDPQHTYVLWHVKHFGFTTQVGKWYASGTLTLDKDKPQNSKVNATIQVSDMITGIPELDKHLKGNLFFDVDKFPTATFVSDKVEMKSKTQANVSGILTLHGISKPVSMLVKLNMSGMSPITDKMTVGFTANTKIKRSDFGINTLLPGLSDEVSIDIEAEAFQATK